MQPDTFDPNIAHIQDNDNIFQVLNENGNDWDEQATKVAYEAWKLAQTSE
jgi:hypothetical protein